MNDNAREAQGNPGTESPRAHGYRGMVAIPGGSFRMGSDGHYPEEAPAHIVRVDAFWIDRHAVTNADFKRFVDETGYVTLAEKPAGVVVDFTDVEFLASVGMGVLVAAHDEAGDDIRFSVVADGPATSRPLKLIGIADILPVFPTLDEALTAQRA